MKCCCYLWRLSWCSNRLSDKIWCRLWMTRSCRCNNLGHHFAKNWLYGLFMVMYRGRRRTGTSWLFIVHLEDVENWLFSRNPSQKSLSWRVSFFFYNFLVRAGKVILNEVHHVRTQSFGNWDHRRYDRWNPPMLWVKSNTSEFWVVVSFVAIIRSKICIVCIGREGMSDSIEVQRCCATNKNRHMTTQYRRRNQEEVHLSEELSGESRFQIWRSRLFEGYKWVSGWPTKRQGTTSQNLDGLKSARDFQRNNRIMKSAGSRKTMFL